MTEKKLRVMLICLTRRGGMLHFVNCLTEGLADRCDVLLVCAANAEREKTSSKINIRTIDTGIGKKGTIFKLFAPKTWKDLRQISDEFQPDIVHVTTAQEWNPVMGWFIQRKLRKPLIYTVHDVIHHEGTPVYFKITESIFRKMPDGFVVMTDQGRQILISRGIPEKRILLAPHGVYDFFTQYGGDKTEQKEILFFGRIEPYKGIGILLEAARPLLDEFPDWTLRIAGSGDVIPYQDLLNHPRIRLDNRFLSDEEVANDMREASIVALPYISASQSGVIPTAYAFGKAVIATSVGGIPDMVKDGETGLLIPPNDPEALRTALRKLMDDAALRSRLGQAGQTYAATELSWKAIAEKHEAFYRKFI